MAYSGYLLKVIDKVNPENSIEITGENFIEIGTYQGVLNVQDIDSYRDGEGVLHRNALSHTPISVDFNLRKGLDNDEIGAFMSAFQDNYINAAERKVRIKAFIQELNDYVEQDVYMATPKFKVEKATQDKLYYTSTQISFVGY